MPKSNTPHLIIITPNHTKIDDEIITPCSISIVLENGHSFDIAEVAHYLEAIDLKNNKETRPGRIKRFTKALKQAVKESAEEDSAMAVRNE
jgi:hypothetical protein